MNIEYKAQKEFTEKELQDLFLSVEWYLGQYPDKLVIAMQNSSAVFTAWDGDKLVGLISAIADGATTAYLPNLLVDPRYQHLGIGQKLLNMMIDQYKEYLGIVLIADKGKASFYECCGFEVEKTQVPIFRISRWG
ncbi:MULTISPECIES: GNAT family N-acetyltransferase [unclassified Dysgonomonas]|uniref:GNAT family N-acetyltransferase n=1 Tax=unclassified Dysgonomonas TaxID=2630389 RepID=UPI0013EAF554|nr:MULTISPECIES: GNAT family N-acetyltransferase [unclassified Dysgonomonas]